MIDKGWVLFVAICMRNTCREALPSGGGGGVLTLALGTHCKTDSRSCGCRLEKKGLSQTQELSEGGCQRGISCWGCSW